MRNACRKAFAAIALVCGTCFAGHPQNYPNRLTMDSVRPDIDSVFLRQMRTRMAQVRTREKRPTVGLVLSGGGAKGAAQVGAMMFLEEMGIPVDLVCGTSIGGLLGGLYAMGYSAADLRDLFVNQDWDKLLTDAVDQKYIPYSTKIYNSKYLLTIPFQNAIDILESGKRDEEEYRKQTFMSSLPSGYAFGFNVNNQISSLTVGYQDSLSFRDLPKPFVCVASDMISCKAKNWGSGSINTALRSTMSIPGLFDPVRTEGMVLIDGGTRNNFPTDIARAMGADIVIGIELSDLMPGFDEVNNIGDILSQMISMLGMDAYYKNIDKPDVFIKPSISEFNMLSFSAEAVDTMIVRGYKAAKAKQEDILRVKRRVGNKKTEPVRNGAVNISTTSVQISSIEFEGVDEKTSRILAKMVDFDAGDMVDKEIMDDVMSRFQATGDFSSLTYSLYGRSEPYRLVFHCEPAPANSIGLGARIDSEEWASILLNIGINTNSLSGSTLSLTAKLGQNLKASAHYSFNLASLPTINFDAGISQYSGNLGLGTDRLKYGVSYWSHKELLYLTDVRWTKLNFKIGLRNQYNNVDRNTVLGAIIASNLSKDALVGDYLGAFATSNFCSFDNLYYPDKGTNLALSVNYDFAKLGDSSFNPILAIGFDWKSVFDLGRGVALIPDLHLRNIFNKGDITGSDGHTYNGLSLLHNNFIGGAIQGRYTENQVPFFGINNTVLTGEQLGSASLELRYNPYKKLYVSALAGVVKSSDRLFDKDEDLKPDFYAFGVAAGYNLGIGPLKMDVHWNQVHKWGVYVSFGYDF